MQPPSGGCVLKLSNLEKVNADLDAAAFGRLCVETLYNINMFTMPFAAAFGRLCVETLPTPNGYCHNWQPPSGGCVLKQLKPLLLSLRNGSRLRAAVC